MADGLIADLKTCSDTAETKTKEAFLSTRPLPFPFNLLQFGGPAAERKMMYDQIEKEQKSCEAVANQKAQASTARIKRDADEMKDHPDRKVIQANQKVILIGSDGKGSIK